MYNKELNGMCSSGFYPVEIAHKMTKISRMITQIALCTNCVLVSFNVLDDMSRIIELYQ